MVSNDDNGNDDKELDAESKMGYIIRGNNQPTLGMKKTLCQEAIALQYISKGGEMSVVKRGNKGKLHAISRIRHFTWNYSHNIYQTDTHRPYKTYLITATAKYEAMALEFRTLHYIHLY